MTYENSKKHLTLRTALITAGVALVLALAVWNMKDRIFGTTLRLWAAADGSTLENSFLPIAGSAPRARNILINGRSIAVDREGNFSDGVLLSPGYNEVSVALLDRFGAFRVKTYHFVVATPSTVAALDGALSTNF